MQLYLASASPRRRELLKQLNIPFIACSTHCDERRLEGNWANTQGDNPDFVSLVHLLAEAKARLLDASLRSSRGTVRADYLILAADTIVTLDHHVYGKGNDAENSFAILKKLIGRTHRVYTGMASLDSSGRSRFAADWADVTFKRRDDAALIRYIEQARPYDKAGAYGIQDEANDFIQSISGEYSTVLGFSMPIVNQLIAPYRPSLSEEASTEGVCFSWKS